MASNQLDNRVITAEHPGRKRRRPGRLAGWLLVLVLGWCLAWPGPAAAIGLPGRRRAPEPAPAANGPVSGRLQEVAPPLAVQDLRQALAEHEPRIRILAPADGSLVAAGPWTLKLEVQDWPLVDAGALGLGPHLVAQLDDQPPIRLTATEAEMPALSPGSHRLTVYAARPWGEAVKSPGAYRQIRLHRLAANPLAVPAPGSPQLIPVLPGPDEQREPVLLDWLLLDAPLQNLRGVGTEGWRLRVSVNGDSFLVDQQTPLWLRGWRPGENALQLELVDGRGEPLSPPFNALVRGVTVSGSAPQPLWQGSALNPADRARLLGEAPPLPPDPAPMAAAPDEPDTATVPEPEPEPQDVPPAPAAPQTAAPTALQAEPQADTETRPQAAEPPGPSDTAAASEPVAEDEPEPEPEPEAEAMAATPPVAAAAANDPPAAAAVAPPSAARQKTEESRAAAAAASPPEPRSVEPQAAPEPARPAPPAPPPGSPSAARSAREEVNPDGTLIRPAPRGPLAGLRQRLGR